MGFFIINRFYSVVCMTKLVVLKLQSNICWDPILGKEEHMILSLKYLTVQASRPRGWTAVDQVMGAG